MTLTVRPDRLLLRAAGNSRRYVLLRVVAPRADATAKRRPVNLAFVLDRSGSMSGPKIELAKAAVADAVARLTPE